MPSPSLNPNLTQVRHAMQAKKSMLLAHEMIGISKTHRNGCEFSAFFACEAGATPGDLIGKESTRGIPTLTDHRSPITDH